MRLPDGFEARATAPDLVLVCRSQWMDEALAAGLGNVAAWDRALAAPAATGAGRGHSGRAQFGGGPPLHLKQLRRGGLLGSLRRGLFFGTRRAVANLSVAQEAVRRGVATATPVAALLRDHGFGFHEGWLAVEEIGGVLSLHARLASGGLSADETRAALHAVRSMHDRGIVHRDLNLGNLLVRGTGAACEGFVIDLDRARVVGAPVSMRVRRAALLRLERSHEKWFGPNPVVTNAWYRLYAEGREDLRDLVTRGRWIGRIRLSLHRLGWKLTHRGGPPGARARSADSSRSAR